MKPGIFSDYVYVKLNKNQFIIRHIKSNYEITVVAHEPFTTNRLLVGNFTVAERLLTEAVKKLYKGKWFKPAPFIVIHPLSMTDGGLSEVEERAIHELAAAAGASKVSVWVGKELTDEEVVNLL